MSPSNGLTRTRPEELKVGDRITVEHVVTVGHKQRTTTTTGTVVAERRRHGLHRRNVDDKVFSDSILLELPDGELTTVTLDEFTTVRAPKRMTPSSSSRTGGDSLFQSHPRSFGENRYVYPVLSRRAGGISLGLNLNIDKVCNFGCVCARSIAAKGDSRLRRPGV